MKPLLIIRESPIEAKGTNLLKGLLRNAGIKESDTHWGSLTGITKARTITSKEIESGRSQLDKLIRDSSPDTIILLVGATPLKAWRPDLTVARSAGMAGRWGDSDGNKRYDPPWHGGRSCYCCIHPINCVYSKERSWNGDPSANKAILTEQILDVGMMVNGVEWYAFSNGYCPVAKCGLKIHPLDEERDIDGVAYCPQHWRKYGGSKWKEARNLAKKMVLPASQISLFS